MVARDMVCLVNPVRDLLETKGRFFFGSGQCRRRHGRERGGRQQTFQQVPTSDALRDDIAESRIVLWHQASLGIGAGMLPAVYDSFAYLVGVAGTPGLRVKRPGRRLSS